MVCVNANISSISYLKSEELAIILKPLFKVKVYISIVWKGSIYYLFLILLLSILVESIEQTLSFPIIYLFRAVTYRTVIKFNYILSFIANYVIGIKYVWYLERSSLSKGKFGKFIIVHIWLHWLIHYVRLSACYFYSNNCVLLLRIYLLYNRQTPY